MKTRNVSSGPSFDLFNVSPGATAGIAAAARIPNGDHKPLQSRAVLVRLKFGLPRRARQDSAMTADLAADHGASADSVSVMKKFYPGKAWKRLQPVIKAAGALRAHLYEQTAPWTDRGLRILPTGLFLEFTAELRKRQGEFNAAADTLAAAFDTAPTGGTSLLDDCRAERNGLFDRDDYPADAKEFRDQLTIGATWCPVPDASSLVLDLEADALREVQESTEAAVREALAEAGRDAWRKLAAPVRAMVARLSEPDATFRDSLVGNLRDVLAALPALNLGADAQLDAFITEIGDKLATWTPEQLRDNAGLRQTVAADADAILARMKDFLPGA